MSHSKPSQISASTVHVFARTEGNNDGLTQFLMKIIETATKVKLFQTNPSIIIDSIEPGITVNSAMNISLKNLRKVCISVWDIS